MNTNPQDKEMMKSSKYPHNFITKQSFWLILVILSLLMLLVGYLLGSIYPFGKTSLSKTDGSSARTASKTDAKNKLVTKKTTPSPTASSNTKSTTAQAKSAASSKTSTTSKSGGNSLSPSTANTSNESSEGEMTTTEQVNAYKRNFEITYPDDWTLKNETNSFSTTVTLVKNDFKIIIEQADSGSARCVYSDEADYGVDLQYPNTKYSDYVEFVGQDEVFRRTQFPAQDTQVICSEAIGTATEFGLYSMAGFIKYETPIHPTDQQLAVMDKIVASIKAL